ncbi:hypothetical protein QYM36_015162, partial [Artemia franciscana]
VQNQFYIVRSLCKPDTYARFSLAEDKHDVAAEDLTDEAAEKKEAEETAKRDSKPDSGVEETGCPGSLRKRKSRKH